MPVSNGAQISFGAYLLALLLVGLYFYQKSEMKRLSSYMIADREVGTWTTAFSQVASFASGFTFLAFVGIGYGLGLSALWYAFFTALAQLFVWRYMGSPFRRLSEKYDSLTLVDHISIHFERTESQRMGDIVRVLGTVIIVVFMGAYLGGQLVAVGSTAEGGLDLNYQWTVIIGGLVIAAYTTLGGFNASVWTDYLQGWLMLLAAIAFPILAINEVGGWNAFLTEVAAIDPALLTWSGGNTGIALLLFVLGWMTYSLAILGQPHAMQRFQAIKSEQVVSRGAVIATAFSAIRMSFPVFIGLSARVLLGGVDNPEQAMVEGIPELFPSIVAGILLAGIVSAILSTTDSMLIMTSADITRNVYEKYVNPDADDTRLIYIGRFFVVSLALVGIGLAMLRPASIFDIIMFGFTGLGACLGPVLLLSIYWEGLTGWGAIAGMISGLAMTVLNRLYIYPEYFPVLVWPITFVTILVVSLATASAVPEREVAVSD